MFGAGAVGLHWGDVVLAHLEPTLAVSEWVLDQHARVSIAESALTTTGGKILLIHDVTLATQMKAELERSQRLAAMGEMAASLAHQLRTPLAAALLYSVNLGKPDMPAETRTKFSEKAIAQLRRLERLIQDVLLFARGEVMGQDPIVLADFLQEIAQTVEPLMREAGVHFSLDASCGALVFLGARKALQGAVINLLENALQATSGGGKICLAANLEGGELLLAVRDSGPGIPLELQSRIFEPFFTTKGQGTGLGLAIAQGVAKAHGGRIVLFSKAGDGAEFVLIVPVAPVEGA